MILCDRCKIKAHETVPVGRIYLTVECEVLIGANKIVACDHDLCYDCLKELESQLDGMMNKFCFEKREP